MRDRVVFWSGDMRKLPESTIRALRGCCLRTGWMIHLLDRLVEDQPVGVIAYCDLELAGWCFATPKCCEPSMSIYVRKPFRRLGIGRRLMRRLHRIAKVPHTVYPWDKRGLRFYQSVGCEDIQYQVTFAVQRRLGFGGKLKNRRSRSHPS